MAQACGGSGGGCAGVVEYARVRESIWRDKGRMNVKTEDSIEMICEVNKFSYIVGCDRKSSVILIWKN